MMKLKYSICCGLDVHKNVIVATIVTTNKDGISEYNQKSFSTINSDTQRFHNWLIENNCYHVCMESSEKNRIQNCMTVSEELKPSLMKSLKLSKATTLKQTRLKSWNSPADIWNILTV